jgi:lipopolysaccharide transport system ATP-binding protein
VGNLNPKQVVEFLISFQANIGPGTYSIAVAAHTRDNHLANNYEWRDQALIFNVINPTEKEFVGLSWLPPSIQVHQ